MTGLMITKIRGGERKIGVKDEVQVSASGNLGDIVPFTEINYTAGGNATLGGKRKGPVWGVWKSPGGGPDGTVQGLCMPAVCRSERVGHSYRFDHQIMSIIGENKGNG